jgi:hypothetical protein
MSHKYKRHFAHCHTSAHRSRRRLAVESLESRVVLSVGTASLLSAAEAPETASVPLLESQVAVSEGASNVNQSAARVAGSTQGAILAQYCCSRDLLSGKGLSSDFFARLASGSRRTSEPAAEGDFAVGSTGISVANPGQTIANASLDVNSEPDALVANGQAAVSQVSANSFGASSLGRTGSAASLSPLLSSSHLSSTAREFTAFGETSNNESGLVSFLSSVRSGLTDKFVAVSPRAGGLVPANYAIRQAVDEVFATATTSYALRSGVSLISPTGSPEFSRPMLKGEFHEGGFTSAGDTLEPASSLSSRSTTSDRNADSLSSQVADENMIDIVFSRSALRRGLIAVDTWDNLWEHTRRKRFDWQEDQAGEFGDHDSVADWFFDGEEGGLIELAAAAHVPSRNSHANNLPADKASSSSRSTEAEPTPPTDSGTVRMESTAGRYQAFEVASAPNEAVTPTSAE